MTVKINRIRYALILLAALVIVRLPTFIYPILDEDEAIHAVIGGEIANGGDPYLDGTDSKFPLLWYEYAGVFKVFGLYNMIAVHGLTLALVWITALLLAFIGERLRDPPTGALAGIAYALFSTASFYKILGSNFELHMLPWECAAAVFAVVGAQSVAPRTPIRRGPVFSFAAGLCIGFSILTKQQGGMMLFTLPVACLVAFRPRLKLFLAQVVMLGLGAGIVGALFAAFAEARGYFAAMWYWAVDYPRYYIVSGAENVASLARTLRCVGFWILGSLPLWLAAGFTLRRRPRDPLTRFAVVWLALSWMPVSLGGRFYAHYFLLNLPGLSLLAAPVLGDFFSSMVAPWRRFLVAAVCLIPVVIFTAGSCAMPSFKKWEGVVAPDFTGLGEKIAALVPENSRIFVWGWAPEFYVYSARRPASRFVFCDYLSGRMSGTDHEPSVTTTYRDRIIPGTWEKLAEDFARHRPYLIIDAAVPDIHAYRPYPLAQYPELAADVALNYIPLHLDGLPAYICKTCGNGKR